VVAALDPVLVPHGFAPGQVATTATDTGVTFCMAWLAFRERFGGLSGGRGDDPEPWWCADVVVEVRGGRLDEVRIDGHGLGDLLRAVGRDDLAPEAAGLDLPTDLAAASKAAVLVAVLADGDAPLDVPVPTGRSGPLCEVPLGTALDRVADLLATGLDAAAAGQAGAPPS
jgi:hypothetical protein